jgi:hypothetical protein
MTQQLSTPPLQPNSALEIVKIVLEKLSIPYETIKYPEWPGDDARTLIKVDRKTHFYFKLDGNFARQEK